MTAPRPRAVRTVRKSPPHPGLGKGVDFTMMAVGVGVAVLGVVALCIGLFTRFGLRIGPIPIPLTLVGPAFAVLGLAIAVISLRQLQCKRCQKPLELVDAHFTLDREADVLEAVQSAPADLAALEMGSGAESSIHVTLEYCETCRAIASLKVEATGDQTRTLHEEVVLDARLEPLIDVMCQRDAAHDQQDDESAEEE